MAGGLDPGVPKDKDIPVQHNATGQQSVADVDEVGDGAYDKEAVRGRAIGYNNTFSKSVHTLNGYFITTNFTNKCHAVS